MSKHHSTKHTVHLIPSFHHDVEYLKTYEEYIDIGLDNLREMFEIMRRDPDYTFFIEQVVLLEELWEREAGYREELKRLVQEGRIELSPGMYSNPDMNIPSGESLIRQVWYGKRWIIEHLGAEPKAATIGDSFGHHAQLPQIMKGCGYNCYLFSRGIDSIERKSDFYWEGIDGTRIFCHWLVQGYGAITFTEDEEGNFRRLKEVIEKEKPHCVTDLIMVTNGGDFVRPQPNAPQRVRRWNELNPDTKIVFSTPSRYFSKVIEKRPSLEVFRGEFNPDFQGCYSSRIKVKQENRSLEHKLYTAEALSSLVSILFDEKYPQAKFDEAWKSLLINQFHDTISGTVIDSCYRTAMERYRNANRSLDEIVGERMKLLAKSANPVRKFARGSKPSLNEGAFSNGVEVDGRPSLLVFNPMATPSKEVVEVDCEGLPEAPLLLDSDGREVPSQLSEGKLLFVADLPAFGYATYRVEEMKAHPAFSSGIKVTRDGAKTLVETPFYQVEFAPSGVISSLIYKDSGCEYVDRERPFFNDLVMQSDNGDLWTYYEGPCVNGAELGLMADPIYDPMPLKPKLSTTGRKIMDFVVHSKDARVIESETMAGEAVDAGRAKQGVEIVEEGPVRATVRVANEMRFWQNAVSFVQYVHFYRDLRRIDFRTEVMPSGQRYRLRVCFPTNIKGGVIRHEIPFGIQERPEGEYPAQNWIDYSDDEKGIYIFNRGLPGNNVTDGVAMISLMRSVNMWYKGPSDLAYEDGVPHSFFYSILPYIKGEEIHPTQIGRAINTPVLVERVADPSGDLPPSRGFLTVEPANVVVSALKTGEDGLVLRLYESEGTDAHVKVRFRFEEFNKCFETDMMEREIKPVDMRDNLLEFNIKAFEVKTFKLRKW